MKIEKKLSQLKNSKAIQPDINWEKSTKYKILGEIASQNNLMKANKLSKLEKIDLFFSRIMKRIIPSTTKAVASFLVLVIFMTTGFQAQASVPGEILWPVKRGIEKAELTLTVDPVKTTKLHIKHVSKRLTEINKIIKEKKSEKNNKVIKKAVQHLKQDSSSLKSSLDIVKEEKNALEIVELAQVVKESAQEVSANIKVAQEENELAAEDNQESIEEALTDIALASDEVSVGAIEIALEVHEEIVEAAKVKEEKKIKNLETEEVIAEDNIEVVTISDAEAVESIVTDMIISEIADLEENIKVTKDKTAIVEYDEMKDTEEIIKEENNGILKVIDIEDVTVKSVKEKPIQAKKDLEEAKVFLEEGSLKEALEKVADSKEEIKKADVVLEKVKKVKKDKESKEVKEILNIDKEELSLIKEKEDLEKEVLPILKEKEELPIKEEKEIAEVILEEEQE